MKTVKGMLALMIVPLMIGCSDDEDTTGPAADVAGTYQLQTVNGQALPVTLGTQGSVTIEVTADEYVLRPDGTFSSTITFRHTDSGTVTTTTDSYEGSWQANGSTIRLNSVDVGLETAAFTGGNTLTFTFGGSTLVYRK